MQQITSQQLHVSRSSPSMAFPARSVAAAGFSGRLPVFSAPQLQKQLTGGGVRQLGGMQAPPTQQHVHLQTVHAARGRSYAPDMFERAIAVVPYLLPFISSTGYGRYLFHMYPAVKAIIIPFAPLISAYHSIPLASMIAFFAIYLGIVNNKVFTRFVRFNGMQAMLLDIMLVLPRLVENLITPPASGTALQVYQASQSFIWIFTISWVLYSVVNALLGRTAKIPFIGDAAEGQLP